MAPAGIRGGGGRTASVHAGERASACALLEAAISHYEAAGGRKSGAVKSALRRAEQLLASLPDEERQRVSFLLPPMPPLSQTLYAPWGRQSSCQLKAPELQIDDEALVSCNTWCVWRLSSARWTVSAIQGSRRSLICSRLCE